MNALFRGDMEIIMIVHQIVDWCVISRLMVVGEN